MTRGLTSAVLAIGVVIALGLIGRSSAAPVEESPLRYTARGELIVPSDYREWIFLSSGLDMNYAAGQAPAKEHVFGNVFAPPVAYRSFLRTGVWPDRTILIVENRRGTTRGSINKAGQFQTGVLGIEAHVKDMARFKGGWGFFLFNGKTSAALIDYKADCYSCHLAHAAADTTFVQFYPTLLPVAQARRTLSPAYLAEEARLGVK